MNDSGVYNLFVYGSLRSGFKSTAYEYISRFFSFVGDAKVKGKLFDLGAYPAGVPVSSENFITGELYDIKRKSEFTWAMGQLDDYEGTAVETGEVQLYKRELVDVYIDNNIIRAWIYWYVGSTEGRPLIESGDMIQYLREKNKPGATFTQ